MTSWSEPRVTTLSKLWLDGLSASQIAKQLGGVTRNAVIGKVHRLGLSGRDAPSAPGPASRVSAPRPAWPRRAPVRATPRAPQPVRIPVAAPSAAPEGPGLITDMSRLGVHACKWPIGDPGAEDFCFCGHKPRDSSPYCEYHARLAYQPLQDRRHRKVSNG